MILQHLANFRRYIKERGLVDIWRQANAEKRDYTFFSNQHKTCSRIDAILDMETLVGKLRFPNIGLRVLSDHAWVTVNWFAGSKIVRTHSWRLNNFFLECPGLRGMIETQIQSFFQLMSEPHL